MVTHADFILVVEKDATFQKLLDAKFCEKLHPCILITVNINLYMQCENTSDLKFSSLIVVK